jgi:hypothetical protein
MSVISAKIFLTGILRWLVLTLTFFLATGTMFLFYGWLFLMLFYSFFFGMVMWPLRYTPGLIEERVVEFKSN